MSKAQIKQKKIYTFFLIDILCMKEINASYGFKNGDLIISQVFKLLNNLQTNISNLLNSNFSIKIKHLYVDVFSIKINTKLNIQVIHKIKDLILFSIKECKFKIKQSSNISIDLTISSTCTEKKNLRIYAEKALNNAKLNNNDFAFYDSNLFEENDNLIECIEYNIKENLVEAYFQKIVSCISEKTIKYEALMRLKDKNGKILFPGSFIQKSKTYRLYPKLMSILIIKVINIIKEHKLNISINLDYSDLINPNIKTLLLNSLKENDIGKYLTIEILESEKIKEYELINSFIKELKEYEVKIAIDDFGSGFSNYENILNLDIDYIKIDGSLIKKIHIEIYRNLIKSIVQFCKIHNIKVIAEFVSDIKIFRNVKSLEIDYAQGYYFNKAQELKEILGENSEK